MLKNLLIAFYALTLLACTKEKSEPSDDYIVTTVAGSGVYGYKDGPASSANFSFMSDITVDKQGNLFVADGGNYVVRKISTDGMVTTLAGSQFRGYADGQGRFAKFRFVRAITNDGAGNIYVSDEYSIRKITPSGMVSTLAGVDSMGSADGLGPAARFTFPGHIQADVAGNVYVIDDGNVLGLPIRIRKITPAGLVSTVRELAFYPLGLSIDNAGNLYSSNTMANDIVKISPDGSVSSIIKDINAYVYDICFDQKDAFYFEQSYIFGETHSIYKIDMQGKIIMVAGNDKPGYVDGTGTDARFQEPGRMIVDANQNLYVVDHQNGRIRKISRR